MGQEDVSAPTAEPSSRSRRTSVRLFLLAMLIGAVVSNMSRVRRWWDARVYARELQRIELVATNSARDLYAQAAAEKVRFGMYERSVLERWSQIQKARGNQSVMLDDAGRLKSARYDPEDPIFNPTLLDVSGEPDLVTSDVWLIERPPEDEFGAGFHARDFDAFAVARVWMVWHHVPRRGPPDVSSAAAGLDTWEVLVSVRFYLKRGHDPEIYSGGFEPIGATIDVCRSQR